MWYFDPSTSSTSSIRVLVRRALCSQTKKQRQHILNIARWLDHVIPNAWMRGRSKCKHHTRLLARKNENKTNKKKKKKKRNGNNKETQETQVLVQKSMRERDGVTYYTSRHIPAIFKKYTFDLRNMYNTTTAQPNALQKIKTAREQTKTNKKDKKTKKTKKTRKTKKTKKTKTKKTKKDKKDKERQKRQKRQKDKKTKKTKKTKQSRAKQSRAKAKRNGATCSISIGSSINDIVDILHKTTGRHHARRSTLGTRTHTHTTKCTHNNLKNCSCKNNPRISSWWK